MNRPTGKSNNLPLWCNDKTMGLNHLILANIQQSHYFKTALSELKTYHEVVDEIYYKVNHMEPWEKGSRKTAGQTGMCGGVRGVGAGGIVSTAFCILYKLFTLKLTRKQLNGLITHRDSPYLRGLGFMYIRFTQPPADLWEWYEPYLEDEEEIDVRAGGGSTMSVGEMLRHFLTKLEWYATLFPRIPVPIQKEIEIKLNERFPDMNRRPPREPLEAPPMREGRSSGDRDTRHIPDNEVFWGEAERQSRLSVNSRTNSREKDEDKGRDRRDRDRKDRDRRDRSRDRDKKNRDRDRSHRRSRSPRSRRKSCSRSPRRR